MKSSIHQKEFVIQNKLYSFPYHYLPKITSDGRIEVYRQLQWGLEYMTYLTYVSDIIHQYSPGSICDIGCGDGRLLSMLNGIGQKAGVDLSQEAIAFARAFAADIQWYCCDAENIPGVYDIVTCIETMEHVPDHEIKEFVLGLHSKISENGKLIISVPTCNRPVHPKHYRHYTQELLREQLQPYFKIEKVKWVYRIGLLEKILNYLLVNRFFILRYGPALRFILKIHKGHCFFADSSNGAHLIAIASVSG